MASGEFWLVKNQAQFENVLREIDAEYKKYGEVAITIESGPKMITALQRNAIWLWCGQIAEALRANDVSMVQLLASMKKAGEIYPTKTTIREFIWKPVQRAITGTESMKKLTRSEVDQIIDPISKFIGGQHGIAVPFPQKKIDCFGSENHEAGTARAGGRGR